MRRWVVGGQEGREFSHNDELNTIFNFRISLHMNRTAASRKLCHASQVH